MAESMTGRKESEQEPTISVVIPSYNSAPTIGGCLEASVCETGPGDEIIIVDSSDDGTPQLIAAFPSVHLLRRQTRTLPGESRNIGVKESRCDVVAFLDADCRPSPGRARTVRAAHKGSPHLCIGGALANANPERLVSWADYFITFSGFFPTSRRREAIVPSCNASYKREAFARFGGFPNDIFPGEDTIYNWRLFREGAAIFDPSIVSLHTDRSRIGQFLRHQFDLGNASAKARIRCGRLSGLIRRCLLDPPMPTSWDLRFVATTPLWVSGVLAWGAGFCLGSRVLLGKPGREAGRCRGQVRTSIHTPQPLEKPRRRKRGAAISLRCIRSAMVRLVLDYSIGTSLVDVIRRASVSHRRFKQLSDKGGEGCAVTVIGTLPPVKGISRYCYELSRALSRLLCLEFRSFRDPYPRALYPGGELEDATSSAEFEPGSRIAVHADLSYRNPFSWLLAATRFTGRMLHYQWVTTYHFPIAVTFLIGARLRGRPSIVTAHNIVPHRRHPLDVALTRIVFALADTVIVHSARNARRAQGLLDLPPDKVAVIPHGTLYGEEKACGEGVSRAFLGLPGDATVILFFGGIRKHKGLGILVRSFAQLVSSGEYGALLVIAGQDWGDWEEVKSLISELRLEPYVRSFIRYVAEAEVADFFRSADLVALPYLELESQSGVGMAAISFGRPLVVTDVGGLPELIRDRACIAEPGDVEGLSRSLWVHINDPARRRRASAASRLLAKGFCWDKVSRKTGRLYLQVLTQRGKEQT